MDKVVASGSNMAKDDPEIFKTPSRKTIPNAWSFGDITPRPCVQDGPDDMPTCGNVTMRKRKKRVSDYGVRSHKQQSTINTPLKIFDPDKEIEDLVNCVKAGGENNLELKILRKDDTTNPSKRRRLSMPVQPIKASNFDPLQLFSDAPPPSVKKKRRRVSLKLPRKPVNGQHLGLKTSPNHWAKMRASSQLSKIPVFQLTTKHTSPLLSKRKKVISSNTLPSKFVVKNKLKPSDNVQSNSSENSVEVLPSSPVLSKKITFPSKLPSKFVRNKSETSCKVSMNSCDTSAKTITASTVPSASIDSTKNRKSKVPFSPVLGKKRIAANRPPSKAARNKPKIQEKEIPSSCFPIASTSSSDNFSNKVSLLSVDKNRTSSNRQALKLVRNKLEIQGKDSVESHKASSENIPETDLRSKMIAVANAPSTDLLPIDEEKETCNELPVNSTENSSVNLQSQKLPDMTRNIEVSVDPVVSNGLSEFLLGSEQNPTCDIMQCDAAENVPNEESPLREVPDDGEQNVSAEDNCDSGFGENTEKDDDCAETAPFLHTPCDENLRFQLERNDLLDNIAKDQKLSSPEHPEMPVNYEINAGDTEFGASQSVPCHTASTEVPKKILPMNCVIFSTKCSLRFEANIGREHSHSTDFPSVSSPEICNGESSEFETSCEMSSPPSMNGHVEEIEAVQRPKETPTAVRRSARSKTKIRKSVPKLDVRHTPMGLPKPIRETKEKFSVEEIYLNKNFRTPTEKKWETIFEFPKDNKDGSVSNCEKRKKRRRCDFMTDPSQRKMKWKKNKMKPGRRKYKTNDRDIDEILSQKLYKLDSALKLAELSP